MELAEYNKLGLDDLSSLIKKLKREKNALILAHNYQRMEIQRIADYLGDSLELARKAKNVDCDIILFCGVMFMAETAKILSPNRKVLIPDFYAGCPLANYADRESVLKFKEKHPRTAFIAYVNSSAEVKAEVDICCTSANSVKVANSLEENEVVMLPDRNLALYTQCFTSKKIIPWDGYCHVHTGITVEHIKEARRKHPEAKIIVHPECSPEVIDAADAVGSTSQILKFVRENNKPVIIGTERGILNRIKLEMPDKVVYPLSSSAICPNMKLTTLSKVAWALENEMYGVEVDEEIAKRAYRAIDRMLSL